MEVRVSIGAPSLGDAGRLLGVPRVGEGVPSEGNLISSRTVVTSACVHRQSSACLLHASLTLWDAYVKDRVAPSSVAPELSWMPQSTGGKIRIIPTADVHASTPTMPSATAHSGRLTSNSSTTRSKDSVQPLGCSEKSLPTADRSFVMLRWLWSHRSHRCGPAHTQTPLPSFETPSFLIAGQVQSIYKGCCVSQCPSFLHILISCWYTSTMPKRKIIRRASLPFVKELSHRRMSTGVPFARMDFSTFWDVVSTSTLRI